MATLKTQQKEELVSMLKKHYELDNEANILNFIENIASDCCDKKDVRLELTLIAYSLMGKERTFDTDTNEKTFRILFNPYPSKLLVIKALKEIPELNLSLQKAKGIVDGQEITIDAKLLEKVKTAISDAGGYVISIREL